MGGSNKAQSLDIEVIYKYAKVIQVRIRKIITRRTHKPIAKYIIIIIIHNPLKQKETQAVMTKTYKGEHLLPTTNTFILLFHFFVHTFTLQDPHLIMRMKN